MSARQSKLVTKARKLAEEANSPHLPIAEIVEILELIKDPQIAEAAEGSPATAFNPNEVGWIPDWWPRNADGQTLTPAQRARWFQESLHENSETRSTPSGQKTEKDSQVLQSLLNLHEHMSTLEDYPTPDWLSSPETSPLSIIQS